jgi:hypothetical protein
MLKVLITKRLTLKTKKGEGKMKKSFVLFFVVFVLMGLFFISASSTKMQDIEYSHVKVQKSDVKSLESGNLKRDPDFGNIPLYFIPNKGQVDVKARFYAKTSRYTLWMTKEGFVFDSIRKAKVEIPLTRSPKIEATRKPENQETIKEREGIHNSSDQFITHHSSLNRAVSRLVFLNANKNPEMAPIKMTPHKVNYFKGNDPSKWQAGIQTSKAVLYKGVYEDIDLKVYGIEKQVEYDWIVKPGADPRQISFKYEHVSNTRIDKGGNLIVETKFGKLMHKKPVSYQVIDGKKITVESKFKKKGKNTYGFKVKKYNQDYELIIDPMVSPIYSTYLGGSSYDYGYDIAVDSNGYAYVTGYTDSTNFPTQNPYQGTLSGSFDVFVAKLSPIDGCPVYSTYLGGSSDEYGYGIAIDSDGHVYVAGKTESTDFPTENTYQGTLYGSSDVFVTKLSPSGNSLMYSTYLGGSSSDYGYGIAVDWNGSAYVTGDTNSTDFPTENPYQGTPIGLSEVFVTKLAPVGNTLLYSTYLGGGGGDHGYEIAVDRNGSAYVTGSTESSNFPTKNPYQETKNGSSDVFVTKLSPVGNTLLYSTYIGGSNYDYGKGIVVDTYGDAYVVGHTRSENFPTKNPYQGTLNGSRDVFVTKLSPAGNTLLYSTYLGGSSGERGFGIAVDRNGSAYVTGLTSSTDFPTKNPYQGTLNGYGEVFVTKLSPAGNPLLYSTYLGGSSVDSGRGIAVDGQGSTYVTGYTESSDFPTHDACQDSLAGSIDVFVSRFCFCDSAPVLVVNKTLLNFSVNSAGTTTGDQSFLIRNIGGSTLNWIVSDDADWIECDPENGTNFGVVTVSVDASGLSSNTYTGTITVTDANAINSPQTIYVTLTVYDSGGGLPVHPFGFFETPGDGAEVMGNVPVTGWALDDIEVISVKLYREFGANLIYMGDALFVEGARPDVAQVYPQYPFSSRAGWGFMLLTNSLMDDNYVLHAIATDKEGNNVTLGTKIITIINATAVKPFGDIDIPTQGGTAYGSDYSIQGWALTPLPKTIPSDGIDLYVDGVNLGKATYGYYREDIYELFPDYNNSDGAGFYYDLNTIGCDNGLHTIHCIATDDEGKADGIGSRYFNIWNLGTINSTSQALSQTHYSMPEMMKIPVDYSEPIEMKKGFNTNIESETVYPDEKGNITIEIKELERIVIHLREVQADVEVEEKGSKNAKFKIQNSK